MDKRKPEDIKRLAMVIIFICIIILLLIVLIWLTHSKDNTSPKINNIILSVCINIFLLLFRKIFKVYHIILFFSIIIMKLCIK